jgi:outer membrane protein assembly factor BamB
MSAIYPHRKALLVAAVLLLLPLLALSASSVWLWADLDPYPAGAMDLTAMALAVACWLALPVYVALSGLGRRVKLTLAAVALVAAGAAAAVTDSVVVNGYLRPVVRFRWQGKGQTLDAYRAQEGPGALPRIDLTVDLVHDFPRYRGVRGDGKVITPLPLSWDWDRRPPKLLWRRPVGGGFAGFAVAGNVAVTVEQRHAEEAVACYDRATGAERWVCAYEARFRHPTGSGPRATPAIDGGEVFSLGATGVLVCLDGKSGRRKWSVDVVEDNGGRPQAWGAAGSPLVWGSQVIVNTGVLPAGDAGGALAAYRRSDGKRLWAAGTFAAGYSSPMKGRLAGREQVLLFDAGGLAGFDPETGEELWRHRWTTAQDMNITQPLLVGNDRVFIASERSNGGALLRVRRASDRWAVEEVWANRALCSKFSNPVVLGGAIYGLSYGTLVCLDQETGARRWRGREYGHGQVLAVGGAVLVMGERGELAAVAADSRRFRELARLRVFEGRTWNTPAVAGGQLFVRNDAEAACFELPVRE